jgi:hypothetical protein
MRTLAGAVHHQPRPAAARRGCQHSAILTTSVAVMDILSGGEHLGLAGRCPSAAAQALRPLAPHRAHPKSACGSPVRGDPHAGFCESRGVRFPPATHLGPGQIPARQPSIGRQLLYHRDELSARMTAGPLPQFVIPAASQRR